MMTPDQRELVRQSLDRLSEEADPVTLLLYGKLFELDPSTAPSVPQRPRRAGPQADGHARRGRKLARPLRVLAAPPGPARTAARQLRRPCRPTTTP